jgi:hypothetical protein
VVISACLGAGVAQAHPHVWVTMRTAIVYTPDGAVTGLRQDWTFDDMYTAFAVTGLEAKKKGQFTRAELQPLAQDNIESLKDFRYFTYARIEANGGKAMHSLRRSIIGSITTPKPPSLRCISRCHSKSRLRRNGLSSKYTIRNSLLTSVLLNMMRSSWSARRRNACSRRRSRTTIISSVRRASTALTFPPKPISAWA